MRLTTLIETQGKLHEEPRRTLRGEPQYKTQGSLRGVLQGITQCPPQVTLLTKQQWKPLFHQLENQRL